MANAVDRSHKYSVGNGVGALNGAPGIVLGFAEFGFLVRMPTDGRGIKKNVCALQRGHARAFGIPLVPTHERANASVWRIKRFEAEIARSEIIFFVVKRIVGN